MDTKNTQKNGGGLHRVMWQTFTYYALLGDSLHPNLMKRYAFARFVQDCKVVGVGQLQLADVNVIFAAESTRPKKHKNCRALTYHTFLNAVMKVSRKVYPKIEQFDLAMKQFVHDNVVPHAVQLTRDSVADVLNQTPVKKLLRQFETPFRSIFAHYASEAEIEKKDVTAKTTNRNMHDERSTATSYGHNTMKEQLRYGDFLRFAKDFGLSNTALLSTHEIGIIFFKSIKDQCFHDQLPKLTFEEFLEAIMRCALSLGRFCEEKRASDELKLKCALLIMWRAAHQHGRLIHALETHITKTTNAADLIHGTMILNNRFTEMWAADKHRDYMAAVPVVEPDAFDLITSICM